MIFVYIVVSVMDRSFVVVSWYLFKIVLNKTYLLHRYMYGRFLTQILLSHKYHWGHFFVLLLTTRNFCCYYHLLVVTNITCVSRGGFTWIINWPKVEINNHLVRFILSIYGTLYFGQKYPTIYLKLMIKLIEDLIEWHNWWRVQKLRIDSYYNNKKRQTLILSWLIYWILSFNFKHRTHK